MLKKVKYMSLLFIFVTVSCSSNIYGTGKEYTSLL